MQTRGYSPFIKNIVGGNRRKTGLLHLGCDLRPVVSGVVDNMKENVPDAVIKRLSIADLIRQYNFQAVLIDDGKGRGIIIIVHPAELLHRLYIPYAAWAGKRQYPAVPDRMGIEYMTE